jgi:hypothetical protein
MSSVNLLDAVDDPTEVSPSEYIALDVRRLARNPYATQASETAAQHLRRNHNEDSAAPSPAAVLAPAPASDINAFLAYVNIDERSYVVREIICITRTVPPSITAALVSLHQDRNGFLRSIPMDQPDTVTISRNCDVEGCPDCREAWVARDWIVQVRCCERVYHAACLADWNQIQLNSGINISCPMCRARWSRRGHGVVTDRVEDQGRMTEDDLAEAEAEEQLDRFLVAEQEAEWRAEQEREQEAQQGEQEVGQEVQQDALQEPQQDFEQEAEQQGEQQAEAEASGEQQAKQQANQEALEEERLLWKQLIDSARRSHEQQKRERAAVLASPSGASRGPQ